MIRSNQKFFNILHIVSDGAIVFFSFVLAYVVRFQVLEDAVANLPVSYYFYLAVISAPLQVLIYSFFHLYNSQRKERFRFLLFRIIYCNLFAYMILMMGLFLAKEVHFSRLTLAFFFAFETFGIALKRYILLHTLYFFRSKGYNLKQIIIVGTGNLAYRYVEQVEQSPHLGYLLIGYVSTEKENLEQLGTSELEYLGNYEELEDILELLKPDEVVVAMSSEDYGKIGQVIETCEKTGTIMSIIPFYTEFFPGNPRVDFFHDIPMLHIRPIPLEHFGWASLKRVIDFFGSIILILVLSPLLLCTAVGVKLSSKGPIIFTQTRVGKNKKEFKMYKFRSMVVNTGDTTTWSQNKDPRKTKFGSFIRKCSIDELPQLFNVLKGEMSLVGPRPEIPHFVEQFKVDIPHYMVKHQVRPGITGWAQISGFRGDTSIEGRILHDIYYIEHWSLWFDIKILLLTLVKGIFNQEKLVQ